MQLDEFFQIFCWKFANCNELVKTFLYKVSSGTKY